MRWLLVILGLLLARAGGGHDRPAALAALRGIIRRVAADCHGRYLDLSTLIPREPGSFSEDRLHLSQRAQTAIGKEIARHIR